MPNKFRKVPHQGYHWNCGTGRFFEGWYYRVTLPDFKQSFAFMYAIDDPDGSSKYSGGSVQVLGVEDQHIWRTLPNVQDFYASREQLELGQMNGRGEGYRASDRHNQGKIFDPVTGITCSWNYEITPIYAGTRATMGWLSYLPVFAPSWQILMMMGQGSGQIQWGDRLYEFENAPVYMEKNWGGAFPEQWFWVQCNTFLQIENRGFKQIDKENEGHLSPDLSLVTAGGKRQTLGISSDVAMVEIYYGGELYSFMPDDSQIYCEVEPWGSWQIRAYKNDKQQSVEIKGFCDRLGTRVMVPTQEGLKFDCLDTAMGKIKLNLRANDKCLRAEGDQAALEVGGDDKLWQNSWKFKSAGI